MSKSYTPYTPYQAFVQSLCAKHKVNISLNLSLEVAKIELGCFIGGDIQIHHGYMFDYEGENLNPQEDLVILSRDWLTKEDTDTNFIESKFIKETKLDTLIDLSKLERTNVAKYYRPFAYGERFALEPTQPNAHIYYCDYLLDGHIVAQLHMDGFSIFEPEELIQSIKQGEDISSLSNKYPDITTLFKGELLDLYNQYKRS